MKEGFPLYRGWGGTRPDAPTSLADGSARAKNLTGWTRCPGWLLAAAGLRLVLHGIVGGGHGFQLDELHFLACGRRLAWAYVDHPALVPWLAHVAESLFGPGITPAELRCFSALAGAATVVLAGLLARELGGGRYAQWMAALTVLVMPLFVSSGELFMTVVFDQLAWALAFWLVVRTLRTGAGRGWLLVGLATGVGLEIKLTMYLFGLGLAVAFVATPVGRVHLRTVWPWLGGALAGGLILPNVRWQQAHGWATLKYMHHNNLWARQEWTLAAFLLSQVVYVGPAAVPLLVLGVRWANSRGAVPAARFILWIAGAVGAVLLVLQGKPYYLGPVYPALLAAGGVAVEAWSQRLADRLGAAWARGLRPALSAGIVLGALPFATVALPILPLNRLADSWERWLNPDLAGSVGWSELAAQVAAATDKLSPEEQSRTTILCISFVEAAAIEQFQPALAARIPVVSPHNTYWFWGPGRRDPQTVIPRDHHLVAEIRRLENESRRHRHPQRSRVQVDERRLDPARPVAVVPRLEPVAPQRIAQGNFRGFARRHGGGFRARPSRRTPPRSGRSR